MAAAVRLLGALLVTLAGLGAGGEAARRMKRRGQSLEELAFALGLLAFELESFCRPLPELCCRLSGETKGAAGTLFAGLCRAMAADKNAGFSACWQEALAPLGAAERELLLPLGSVLGRYGADEQRQALLLCRRRLEEMAAEARETYRRSGRVCVGLGAALGAGLSLMML